MRYRVNGLKTPHCFFKGSGSYAFRASQQHIPHITFQKKSSYQNLPSIRISSLHRSDGLTCGSACERCTAQRLGFLGDVWAMILRQIAVHKTAHSLESQATLLTVERVVVIELGKFKRKNARLKRRDKSCGCYAHYAKNGVQAGRTPAPKICSSLVGRSRNNHVGSHARHPGSL